MADSKSLRGSAGEAYSIKVLEKYTNTEKKKVCTKCKQEKPATLEYFGLQKDTKDGLKCQCKKCRAEYTKAFKERKIITKRFIHDVFVEAAKQILLGEKDD